jgi:hypothetical protein
MSASASVDLWSELRLFGVSMWHPIPYYNRIVKSLQIVNLQLENTGGDERRGLGSG